MTNGLHMLPPGRGMARRPARRDPRPGVVLALDETHSHVIGEGGATGESGWRPTW